MNDYGSSAHEAPAGIIGGVVASVDPDSPAFEAGIEPGMAIVSADGHVLNDLIDWGWWADEDEVELEVAVPQGTADLDGGAQGDNAASLEGSDAPGDGASNPYAIDDVLLQRELGQDWGIEFSDCVFDGMRECRNACTFCFVSMLPKGLRDPLNKRDDDYRLSFLQGNFATLTNLSEEDFERIVSQCISPLRVSLHAVSPDVRMGLMGKHAAHGLEMLERLLGAGIEAHVQIVLVPGVNDGEELSRTLSWVLAHEGILSCGIVPLGYTRYQHRFASSFEVPGRAKEVIEQVKPFQRRAFEQRGEECIRLADEFYIDAGEDFPESPHYGDFEQYEDGIGMARSFIDGWTHACISRGLGCMLKADAGCGQEGDAVAKAADDRRAIKISCITGEAFAPILRNCMAEAGLSQSVEVICVKNDFLGGNVTVAGLLSGVDVAQALDEIVTAHGSGALALLPDAMFNADGVTLDGCTAAELAKRSGARVRVVPCDPMALLGAILEEISRTSA